MKNISAKINKKIGINDPKKTSCIFLMKRKLLNYKADSIPINKI